MEKLGASVGDPIDVKKLGIEIEAWKAMMAKLALTTTGKNSDYFRHEVEISAPARYSGCESSYAW